MPLLAVTAGDVAYYALALFLVADGHWHSRYALFRLGGTFARLSAFIGERRKSFCP